MGKAVKALLAFTLTVLAAVVLLQYAEQAGFLSFLSAPEFPSALDYSGHQANEVAVDGFYRYYYEQLDETEKEAYRAIFNELPSHPERVDIPILNSEQMDRVYNALNHDNPHMLCLEGGGVLETRASGKCSFKLNYEFSAEECEEKTQRMMQKVGEILAGISPGQSEYETEKYIHDHIVQTCRYYEGANPHSAYGALMEGEAMCAGYSKAAQLLLNAAGIRNYLIFGDAQNTAGAVEAHAWNIVLINQQPYHLDVTWDDPLNAGEERIRYSYFNITDAEIGKTHTNLSLAPGCVATAANYYVREGLYFSAFDAQVKARLEAALTSALQSGQTAVEIKFSGTSALNSAANWLIEEQNVYKILLAASRKSGKRVRTDEIRYLVQESQGLLYLEALTETA